MKEAESPVRPTAVAVIVGSIRRGRNTPRLAKLVGAKLDAHPGAVADFIDLAELDLPMMEERLSHLETPPAQLVDFGRRVGAADALVIVTPEYNKGYPGVLKNAIDYLGPEYRRKPVAIATHSVGAFAGQVVLQQLRIVMINVGAVPIPAALTVPHIEQAIDENGGALDEAFNRRAVRFVDELLWYAQRLKS